MFLDSLEIHLVFQYHIRSRKVLWPTNMNRSSHSKRDPHKYLGKYSIIQISMLHLEFGIQIKQGWQFFYYCRNAIAKKYCLSPHTLSHMICMYTRVARPTHQNMYHQKSLSQPKLMGVQKRHFFKIMLQRGVNNTHFYLVKLERQSSLLFEIHPSLKHLFEKVHFQTPIHFG